MGCCDRIARSTCTTPPTRCSQQLPGSCHPNLAHGRKPGSRCGRWLRARAQQLPGSCPQRGGRVLACHQRLGNALRGVALACAAFAQPSSRRWRCVHHRRHRYSWRGAAGIT
jgi:hypothetical protein